MKIAVRNSKYPRRQRPKYPTLEQLPRGQQALMERPECGLNIEHPLWALAQKRRQRVLTGCFIFHRELPRQKPGTLVTGTATTTPPTT